MTVVTGHFITGGAWRYVVARVARVYPLFAEVIIATAGLNAFTSANIFRLDPVDGLWHLALAGSALTVWTISVEFPFYGLFLTVWSLRSRSGSALATVGALLAVSIALMYRIGTERGRIEVPGYLHVFALGLLIAVLTARDDGRWRPVMARAIPVLGLGYCAAFVLVPAFYAPRWIYVDVLAVGLCGALLAAVLLSGDCRSNRLLGLPVFIWLGEVSFGVYLLHRHAEWIVDATWGTAPALLSLPVKIALALVLAQGANRLIERPCRGWLRRLGDRCAGPPRRVILDGGPHSAWTR